MAELVQLGHGFSGVVGTLPLIWPRPAPAEATSLLSPQLPLPRPTDLWARDRLPPAVLATARSGCQLQQPRGAELGADLLPVPEAVHRFAPGTTALMGGLGTNCEWQWSGSFR